MAEPGRDLVLHPPVLAVGVGCERGVEDSELIDLVDATLAAAGLAPGAVASVVSLDLKMDEAAVHAVAGRLGVEARFFTAAEVEAEAPRLANPSQVVFDAVGVHGVAEGAALAAVGADGALIVEKTASKRATCAVARAPATLEAAAVGRAQGRLAVVGIGPGGPEWRTPEATRALTEAGDVVGYGLYLDLLGDLIAGANRHQTPLSQEEERVRKALDLAAEGRSVALVSSGDAGIYALAALVFELLDAEDRVEWNRIALSVVPGVSALQAAAARIGAPPRPRLLRHFPFRPAHPMAGHRAPPRRRRRRRFHRRPLQPGVGPPPPPTRRCPRYPGRREATGDAGRAGPQPGPRRRDRRRHPPSTNLRLSTPIC